MTALPPIAVWCFLCAIIVIDGAISSNHGRHTPRSMALNVPWWENIPQTPIGILNQNNEEMKIPELSCSSPHPSIFNLTQESKAHCTGQDYKVTFYFQDGEEYFEIGSWVIDKYLFNNVLKKYKHWSLTNEKLVPENEGKTSRVHIDTRDNNKLCNEEFSRDFGPLERDTCEDGLVKNMVKEPQSIDSINNCYNHENVTDNHLNNQKLKNLCENLNDKKYISISPKYNRKYNHFEVNLPENMYTSSSPKTINVNLNENNKNVLKKGKNNMNSEKVSSSCSTEKSIPTEHQILVSGDDVSDLTVTDIIDLLLDSGYEVNLNEPVLFNLENSHNIECTQSDLAAEYQKDNHIEANNPSNNVCSTDQEPFYTSDVCSDYKCPDSDQNEYEVDTSDEYYNDLQKNNLKKLKENETVRKAPIISPKYADCNMDGNLESISESLISTQTLPCNKETELAISSHDEADGFVVEASPSTITETLPVNTKEPINNDISLTCAGESMPITIPLTFHELTPLTTICPSASLTNHISDSYLPQDISYINLSPPNFKTQMAKGKFKEKLPTFAKNNLWAQGIPLKPASSLSKVNLPIYPTYMPVLSPSVIAPKTPKFVTKPSMATNFNLNINRDWPKPVSSAPFELSEKCLRQLLELPEIVTVSMSSPEHTNSPSEILLSKNPQVSEALTTTENFPLKYDEKTQSSKWNDYTPIKDYTKIFQPRPSIIENYKLLQQFENNKQIPSFNNIVPNVMTLTKPKTESKIPNGYFSPNVNPYLFTVVPTKEDYIKPVLATRMPMPAATRVLNNFQSIQPLETSMYLVASSLTPKSVSTPKKVDPIPYSISECPATSYAGPFTLNPSPLPIPNNLKTISTSPLQPSLQKINSQKDIMFQPAVVPILPSNFAPLKETQPLLPFTSLPKSKLILKPIYNTFSDPLLDVTNPEPISAITPLLAEPVLKHIPTTSLLEPLSDQRYIQSTKPSSLYNKFNCYTYPSKSNVTPSPLSVKRIEVSKAATLWTNKAIPTTSLPELPILPSEVCATPLLSKKNNNFISVFLDRVSTAPVKPLWSENKIPSRPQPTMLSPSSSILQSNLLETLPASPYIIPINKEFIEKPLYLSPVLAPPSTSPILNAANVQKIPPLIRSNSLATCKKLPTYVFQPKPPDGISISPVPNYATPIISPLNSLTLSPMKTSYLKPSTPAILTTQYTPISPYTFQPHPPRSDVSPLYSKETPMHTISSSFVTPVSYPKSLIYEDIAQTLPVITPMKEIFASGSPQSVASNTPSLVSNYSPLLSKKGIPKMAPSFMPLSLLNSPSIPIPITPIVPSAAYTRPLIGSITKNPTLVPSPLLQNEKVFYPTPQYAPISVNRPLQGKLEPIKRYMLPNLSVDYSPVMKKKTIESIPMNYLTSKLQNQQNLSKQQVPLHAYNYKNLFSPQYYVPPIPKSTFNSFWSQLHDLSQYSVKNIPKPHQDYSHSVQFPLLSPDFSTKSKPCSNLYSLPYAEPLSDLTTFKTSPLISIYDPKSPTYSTLVSSPITNQIIPRKLSTPVINVSPIETAKQILQPLDINKVSPSSEILTSLPQSISNNIWYKKVHPIISPLQPPEPIITPKALFSNNLKSQVLKEINNINTYTSQVMTPTVTPSELKDIASATTLTIPYIKPNIITPCKWSPKMRMPTQIPTISYPYSKIAKPIIENSLTDVLKPLSEISIPQMKTLPFDSSVNSLVAPKYNTYTYTSVLPASIQENKLPLKAFSSLSSLSLPTASLSSYRPPASFLLPSPIKSIYPTEISAPLTIPLKSQQILKHLSLPTTSISHTSIQPLFIPRYTQIPLKKSLDISPYDFAALDVAKYSLPVAPASLPINSKSKPMQYIDWISTISKSKYTESPVPKNSFSKVSLSYPSKSPLIDFAPVLISPLQPPVLETNILVPPISPTISLLNPKRQDASLTFSNTPLTPATISPIITSPQSIQSLFTPKLSVPSEASIRSFKEILPSDLILNPERLITPITTPCDSIILPSDIKLATTPPLDSVKPETLKSYHWASPIPTFPLPNKPLPTPITSLIPTTINTVSNENLQFYDPVPLPEPIRYSTTSLIPVRPLPLQYTVLSPKKFPNWSFAPCSFIKSAPINSINPSLLSKSNNIPCRLYSRTDAAPTMTPQSSPMLPTHRTFASTPISYAPQPSSSMSRSFLPLNTVSPSITSDQQPCSFTKYITPKVTPQNNIAEISSIPSSPAIPLDVKPISGGTKLSDAEYISPLSILSPVKPVSIPSFPQYKTLSTVPKYLPSPSSIIKPMLSSALSDSRNESPITVSPIQIPYKQYSTPPLTSPLASWSTSRTTGPTYTSFDHEADSRIITKYSNFAKDASKWAPVTPTYVTPLSVTNSIITSDLQLTPKELIQYNALTSKLNFFTSPLKTIKPCYANQRLSYLLPNQTPTFTPNYIANLATNTLLSSKTPLKSYPYSNVLLNSAKDLSPTLNAKVSPLSFTQYMSIQPLVLPTTNSVVNPEFKSTTVPLKSTVLPFIPLSNILYEISSPTFVTPLFTPVSSTLDSSPDSKTIPNMYKTDTPLSTPLKEPEVSQALLQHLITNIGIPTPSTQLSPSKFTPCRTYIPSKENNLAAPSDSIEPLQSMPYTKVTSSFSNIQKPMMYEQPLPYKLMSKIDNPPYSISFLSNVCKPLDSVNDIKSPSYKTDLYPNLYSNTLTAVPTWKELPVNPIAQPTSINTRYIDDSMFKTYPVPSNYIPDTLDLETLKYEPCVNNLKSSIPINNNNIVPVELQNYINNIDNIKSVIQAKTDKSIPLGKILIPKNEYINHKTHAITPSFSLKMWPSNVTIVEAELQLKFKDVAVNNFQPIVNGLGPYDVLELQKLVKNYIRNKYGDVIDVPNSYSLNGQYDLIKDCGNNYDNRCNLLWPMDTSRQWGIPKQNLKGIL